MLHDELCPGPYGFMCLCASIVPARGHEAVLWARRNAVLYRRLDVLGRRDRELSQLEAIDRLRQKLAVPAYFPLPSGSFHSSQCPAYTCLVERDRHNGWDSDVRCKGCENGECKCSCDEQS